MKKILMSLLVFILVFSQLSITTAEGFSLRNGISFGDTFDEVKSKETLAFEKIDAEFEDDDEEKEYPYTLRTVEGTIAGIDDSYITYKFNRNKKLCEVQYFFQGYTNKDLIDSDYEKINQGLIRKYGNPLGFSNGKSFIITGGAIEGAVLGYTIMQLIGGVGDMRDYDEWVLYCNEYNVKIEQACYYWGQSYSDIHYSHTVSYTYFTDEDLKTEQDAKQERQDAVDNDI